MVLQFVPALDRTSTKRFAEGRWAIVDFIRQAQSRDQEGSILQLTHEIGGRTITYRIEFSSVTVPFTMRELSEFSCPDTLD